MLLIKSISLEFFEVSISTSILRSLRATQTSFCTDCFDAGTREVTFDRDPVVQDYITVSITLLFIRWGGSVLLLVHLQWQFTSSIWSLCLLSFLYFDWYRRFIFIFLILVVLATSSTMNTTLNWTQLELATQAADTRACFQFLSMNFR